MSGTPCSSMLHLQAPLSKSLFLCASLRWVPALFIIIICFARFQNRFVFSFLMRTVEIRDTYAGQKRLTDRIDEKTRKKK